MNARKVVLVLAPLLAAGLVVALWPKPKRSPEDEVRELVAQVLRAAEARDVSAMADTLDEGFRSSQGTTRQETKQYLAAMLLRRNQGLAVLNPSLTVTVDSPTSAHFEGLFVFAQGSGPDGMSRVTIRGTVAKAEDRWRFMTAEWVR